MKWVIVVDDSDVVRDVAEALLQQLNVMPVTVSASSDALAHCAQGLPDVAIIDEDVGGENGIDLIASLRASGTADHPVIFFSTTENDPDKLADAAHAGASAVFLKPYDLATLRAGLERFGLIAPLVPGAGSTLDGLSAA